MADGAGYDSRPETWEHVHKVQGFLIDIVGRLLDRAHGHDQSKFSEPELSVFNEFTPKLRASTYDSDEYKEFLEGMGDGLRHHYAHNRHHPEFHEAGFGGMDLIDVLELLADWKAATMRHANGDLTRSIQQNAERFGYGEEVERLLLRTATNLGWIEESSWLPSAVRRHE